MRDSQTRSFVACLLCSWPVLTAAEFGTRIIAPLQGDTVRPSSFPQGVSTVYQNDKRAVRISAIFDNDFVLGDVGVAKIFMCFEKFHVDTQSTTCQWAPAQDGDGAQSKTLDTDGLYRHQGSLMRHMLRAQVTGNTLESFGTSANRVRLVISLYHADDITQSLDDTNSPNVVDIDVDGSTFRGTIVSFDVSGETETDFGSNLVEYGIKDDHENIDHEFRSSFTLDRVANGGSLKFTGASGTDPDDWQDSEAYLQLDPDSGVAVDTPTTVSMNRWAHSPFTAVSDVYTPNCDMTVEFWVRPIDQSNGCSAFLLHLDHTLTVSVCGQPTGDLNTPRLEKSTHGLGPYRGTGDFVGVAGLSVHTTVYSKGDSKGQVFRDVLGTNEELRSNAWTHLAFVRSNPKCSDTSFSDGKWSEKGEFVVYVNGEETFRETPGQDDSGFGTLANRDDFDYDVTPYLRLGSGFKGYIDELRIWSSARTASQIKKNLLKTVAARALAHEHLAASWTFDAAFANSDATDSNYYRGSSSASTDNIQDYIPDSPPAGVTFRYIPDQTTIYSEECKYDESPNIPRHCTGVGGKTNGVQAHTLRDIVIRDTANSPSISVSTKKRLSEGTWRFTVGTSYVPNKALLVDFHSFKNQLTNAVDKTINHPSKIRYPGSCSNRVRMEKTDVAWSTLWNNPCGDQSFTFAKKCKQRFSEVDYLYTGSSSDGDDQMMRSEGWTGSVGTINKKLSDLNRNEYHDPNAHWATTYFTKDMSLSELSSCRVCDTDECRAPGGSPDDEDLAVILTENGNVVDGLLLHYTFENMESGTTVEQASVLNEAPNALTNTAARLCNHAHAWETGDGCRDQDASTQHVYGTAFKGHVSARVPTTVGASNSLYYRMPNSPPTDFVFPSTGCNTDPTTCDGGFGLWLRWKPSTVPTGYFMTSHDNGLGNVIHGWQGGFVTVGDKRYIVFIAPHSSGKLWEAGANSAESSIASVVGTLSSKRTGGAVYADVTAQTSQDGWMHVTVSWLVGGYMALYVNGEQAIDNVASSNSGMSLEMQGATGNKFFCIGGCANYGEKSYVMMPDVYFDDFRLFERAPRADEAMDMYLSSSFYRGKLSSRLVSKLSDNEDATPASEELYSFASYQFGISMLGSYGSVSLFQARTFDFQAEFRSATFSDDNHLVLTVDTYVRHIDSTFTNKRTTKLGSAMVVSFPDITKDGEYETWGYGGLPTQQFWFNADSETSGRDQKFYCKSQTDSATATPGPVNCPFDFDIVSPETVTCQDSLPLDRPSALASKTADDYCYQRWTLRTGMNGDTGSKAAIPAVVTDFVGKIPLRFSQMWKSTASGAYEKRGGDEHLEVTLTVDVRRSALDEELSGNQMSTFDTKRTRTYSDISMLNERSVFVRGESVYADLRLDIPGVDTGSGNDFWNDERNWWSLDVTEASVCASVDPSAVPLPYDSFNSGSTGCNSPGFVDNKLLVFARTDNQIPTSVDLATDSTLPNHDMQASSGFDGLIPNSADDSVDMTIGADNGVSAIYQIDSTRIGVVLADTTSKAWRLNRETSVAFFGEARAKIGVASIVVGTSSYDVNDASGTSLLRLQGEHDVSSTIADTDTWSDHKGWSGTGSVALWFKVMDAGASSSRIMSDGSGNNFRLWREDDGSTAVLKFAPWGDGQDGLYAPAEIDLTALDIESNDWVHVVATWDWGAGCSHLQARQGSVNCPVSVGLHVNGGDEARDITEIAAGTRRSSMITTTATGDPSLHPLFVWPGKASAPFLDTPGALYIPGTTSNGFGSGRNTWIGVEDLRLFLHTVLTSQHVHMLHAESTLAASGKPSKFYGLSGAFNSKIIDRRYFDWSSETGISFPVAPLVTNGANLFLEMKYQVSVNDDIYYKPSMHEFELVTEMLSFDGAGLVNVRRVGNAHFSFEHNLLDIHPPGASIGSVVYTKWDSKVGNYWIPKYTRSHHLQGLALRIDSFAGDYGCESTMAGSSICGPESNAGDQAWKGFYAVPVKATTDVANPPVSWSGDKGSTCLWTQVHNDVCGMKAGVDCSTTDARQRARQRVFTVFNKASSGDAAVEIYIEPQATSGYKVHASVAGNDVASSTHTIAQNEWVHACVTWVSGGNVELFVNGESLHTQANTGISFVAGGLGNSAADAAAGCVTGTANTPAECAYDEAFFVGLPRVQGGESDDADLQVFDVDDIRIFSEALTLNDVKAVMLNTAGDHIVFFSDYERSDPVLGANLVAHTATDYATCSNTDVTLNDKCGFRIVVDVVLDESDKGGVIVSRIAQGSSDVDTKAAYHMTISAAYTKPQETIVRRKLKACVGSWLSERFSAYDDAGAADSDKVLCAEVEFSDSDVGGKMHSEDSSTTSGVILRFEMAYTREFTTTLAGTDSLVVQVAERDRDVATAITASSSASLSFGFESAPASSAHALAGLDSSGNVVQTSSGKRVPYAAGPGERTHIGTHYSDSVGTGSVLDADKSINTFQGRIAHMSFYSTPVDPAGSASSTAIAIYNDHTRGTQAYFDFNGRRESSLLVDESTNNIVGNLLNFNQRGQLQLPGAPSGYFTGETRFRMTDLEGGALSQAPDEFWVRLSTGVCPETADGGAECVQEMSAPVGSMWGTGSQSSPKGRYAAQIDTVSASWKYDTVILYRAHGTSGSPSAPITSSSENSAWIKLGIQSDDSGCLYASGWCSNVFIVNTNTRVRIVGKSHIGVVDTRALDAKYLPNLGSQGDTTQAYPLTYGVPYPFDTTVMVPAHVESDFTNEYSTSSGTAWSPSWPEGQTLAWNVGMHTQQGVSAYSIESISSIPVANLKASSSAEVTAAHKLPSTFAMPMVDSTPSVKFEQNSGFTVCGMFRFSGARCNAACNGGQRLISIFGAKTTSAASEKDGTFTYAGTGNSRFGDASKDAFSNLFLRCEEGEKSRFVEIQHDPNKLVNKRTNVIVHKLTTDQAFGSTGGMADAYHQICWERTKAGTNGRSAVSVDGNRYFSEAESSDLHLGLSSQTDLNTGTTKAFMGQSVGLVAAADVLYKHIGVLLLGGYGVQTASTFTGDSSDASIDPNWITEEVPSAHVMLPGKVKDVVAWTWGSSEPLCKIGDAVSTMFPSAPCSTDGAGDPANNIMFWFGPSRMDQFAYTNALQDVAYRCASDAVAQTTSDTTQFTTNTVCASLHGYDRVLRSVVSGHQNSNDGFKHPGYSTAYYIRNAQSAAELYPTVAGHYSAASSLCVASNAIENVTAVGGDLGAAAQAGPVARSANLKVFLYPSANAHAGDAGGFTKHQGDQIQVTGKTQEWGGVYINIRAPYSTQYTDVPSSGHAQLSLDSALSNPFWIKFWCHPQFASDGAFETYLDTSGTPSYYKVMEGGSYDSQYCQARYAGISPTGGSLKADMIVGQTLYLVQHSIPSLQTSRSDNGAVDYDMSLNNGMMHVTGTDGVVGTKGWHLPVWQKSDFPNNAKTDGTSPPVHLKLYDECFLPVTQTADTLVGTFSRVRELACDGSDVHSSVAKCPAGASGQFASSVHNPYTWSMQACVNYDTSTPTYGHITFQHLDDGVRGSNEDALNFLYTDSMLTKLGYTSNAVVNALDIWKPAYHDLSYNAAVDSNTLKDHLVGGVEFACGSGTTVASCANAGPYTVLAAATGISGWDGSVCLKTSFADSPYTYGQAPTNPDCCDLSAQYGTVCPHLCSSCEVQGPSTRQKLAHPMGQSVRFGFEEPEPKTAEPHTSNPTDGDAVDGSFTYCASFRMLPAAEKANCDSGSCHAAWPDSNKRYGGEDETDSKTSGTAQGQYFMTSSEVLRVKNMFKDDNDQWQDAILGVSRDVNNGYSMTVAYMDAAATTSASTSVEARTESMVSGRYVMHELPFVGAGSHGAMPEPESSQYWDNYYTNTEGLQNAVNSDATAWPMCAYDDPDCDPSRVTPWVGGVLRGGEDSAVDEFHDSVGDNAAANTRLLGCIRLDCSNYGAFSYHLYGKAGNSMGHTRWGPESNDWNSNAAGDAPRFADYCKKNNDNGASNNGPSRLQDPTTGTDPPREYLFGDSQGAGGPDRQVHSDTYDNNGVGARVGVGGLAMAWATDSTPQTSAQWDFVGPNVRGGDSFSEGRIYVPHGGSTVESLVTQFRHVQLYDRALSESEMAGLAQPEHEFDVVSEDSVGPSQVSGANTYPHGQMTAADYAALRSGRGRPARIGAHGIANMRKSKFQKLRRTSPRNGVQMVAIKRAVSADSFVQDNSKFAESGSGDGFGYTAFSVSCPSHRPHFHAENRTCQSFVSHAVTYQAPNLPPASPNPPSTTPTDAIDAMEEMARSGGASGQDLASSEHKDDVAHSEEETIMSENNIMWIIIVCVAALVLIGACWFMQRNEGMYETHSDVYLKPRHGHTYKQVKCRETSKLPHF